ncbi:MAG: DUF2070 family protein [Desulfurococcaceae archaeon]
MQLYRPNTRLAKYYRLLFALPHGAVVLAAFVVLLGLVAIALNGEGVSFVVSVIVGLLSLRLYATFKRDSALKKWKRSVALLLVAAGYSLAVGLACGELWVGIASSIALLGVVILGLDGTTMANYATVLAISSAALLTYVFASGKPLTIMVQGMVVSVALLALDYVFYAFMGKRKVGGLGAPDMATLYLRNWLDGDKSIERALWSMGKTSEVRPRLILSNDAALAIIYTDIHYGPFSNVGSSELPQMLEEALRERGLAAFVVHGAGSHERDLVSADESRRFVEAIARGIDHGGDPLLYHGSFEVEHKSWKVLGIVFDRLTLLIVSRPGLGIDDIPYSFQRKYEELAQLRGLGDLMIIDAHNHELVRPMDFNALDEALHKALTKALEIKAREPTTPVISHEEMPIGCPGALGGRAKLLAMRGSDGRDPVVLAYFRGNNMAPGSRDLLVREVSRLCPGAFFEVLTNDEHGETGKLPFIAYLPVHVFDEDAAALGEVAKRLLARDGHPGLAYAQLRVEAKLLNNGSYRMMKAVEEGMLESILLTAVYLLLAPVTAWALSLFPLFA